MASTRYYGEQNVPGAPGSFGGSIPGMLGGPVTPIDRGLGGPVTPIDRGLGGPVNPIPGMLGGPNTTDSPFGHTPQFTGSIGYGDPMQQAGNIAGISFDIGEGHKGASRGAKMYNKTRNNPNTNEVEMIKNMLGGPQLPQAMQTGGTMPGQPGNMAFEVAGGNFLDPRSWMSGEADKQIDAARKGTYQGSGKESLSDQILKRNSDLQNMINQM